MTKRILILIFSLGVPLLLMPLPIFPLISDIHGVSQDGAVVFQTWDFVSMPEFYNVARYARVTWMESTWNNYLILGVVNHVGLILVFFVVHSVLSGLNWRKIRL